MWGDYGKYNTKVYANEKEFDIVIGEIRNKLNEISEFNHINLWNKMMSFKDTNRPTALECAQQIKYVNNICDINNSNNTNNMNNINNFNLGNERCK